MKDEDAAGGSSREDPPAATHPAEPDRGSMPEPHPPGDRVPEADEAKEELVEETSEESFPASDPPSYWGRETSNGGDASETDA